MDFSLTPELLELQQRTRAFIRDKIIPLEGDPRQTPHGPTEEFRRELVALAAAEGLVAPHVGVEYGGLGLSHVGKAVVLEESGYSLLGPVAMHVFAPDEGNMHLLEAVASTEQKERWLRPLASGAGRRVGSRRAEDDGAEGRQPLRHQRRQMVHHRRRGRGLRHHHGEGR
jgi:acyl-CoA dehydrogenase